MLQRVAIMRWSAPSFGVRYLCKAATPPADPTEHSSNELPRAQWMISTPHPGSRIRKVQTAPNVLSAIDWRYPWRCLTSVATPSGGHWCRCQALSLKPSRDCGCSWTKTLNGTTNSGARTTRTLKRRDQRSPACTSARTASVHFCLCDPTLWIDPMYLDSFLFQDHLIVFLRMT